ncbi:hypothetical protein C1H70_07360 [Halomonas urumqiensis]|uniref:Uncharacterized protein n=1 Tax=Halomonas urumqiensis TaxID=1684789 RepID=A0A2N7UKL4_9GAMM|nr:hypothetical protein C1H70_07360 [Halomonas urumqiensis]PTB02944.1 hypothetical protein C6V82_09360 [Halomonas urumqiensis]
MALVVFALLSALLAIPLANATTFNTTDIQRHEHWQSMTLTLGEETHWRAVEAHSYSDSHFSVNLTPGACDLPWLEMRVDLGEHQPDSEVVNRVPADLRVDHETIHNGEAEFITQRGDSGFYVQFHLPEQPLSIEEMRHGETLRLRLMRSEDDPWFMVFSLAGADEALARIERQCQAAEVPDSR